jgi:hypothetical protein
MTPEEHASHRLHRKLYRLNNLEAFAIYSARAYRKNGRETSRKPPGYWTLERLQVAALKFDTRTAFQTGHKAAYIAARKAGLLNIVCAHMTPQFLWTEELIREEALKFESRRDFMKASKDAYSAAQRKGLLDSVCAHMTRFTKPKGYWTKERCREAAAKCRTVADFQRKYPSAYLAAKRGGWRDELFTHMVDGREKWTEESLTEEAKKYSSKVQFQKENAAAFAAALRRGRDVFDSVCRHMPEVKKENGYWTEERLREEALKYKTRADFARENAGAYAVASEQGLIASICGHMDWLHKPWTNDELRDEALKYETRGEFQIKSIGAYSTAKRRGLLDEICDHMEFAASCSDNNVVYIWRHIGARFNRRKVYKIGITSARLGDRRINLCRSRNGMEHEVVILSEVKGKASDIEKQILQMGIDPEYPPEVDGYTEFRAFTAKELERATRLIEQAV